MTHLVGTRTRDRLVAVSRAPSKKLSLVLNQLLDAGCRIVALRPYYGLAVHIIG
jgi:hypothetical protein